MECPSPTPEGSEERPCITDRRRAKSGNRALTNGQQETHSSSQMLKRARFKPTKVDAETLRARMPAENLLALSNLISVCTQRSEMGTEKKEASLGI